MTDTEEKIAEIELQLRLIQKRNERVEAEKAWETSLLRVCLIMAITYAIAAFLLISIDSMHPWGTALIPTVGFFLSTQTLPAIRRSWIEKYFKKKNQ
ncbi:MAG: hypothetical protein JO026_02465 [Patescibacteria group bacterium]|nr:hypothetical protein [Patescibacteria group bacterium]